MKGSTRGNDSGGNGRHKCRSTAQRCRHSNGRSRELHDGTISASSAKLLSTLPHVDEIRCAQPTKEGSQYVATSGNLMRSYNGDKTIFIPRNWVEAPKGDMATVSIFLGKIVRKLKIVAIQ